MSEADTPGGGAAPGGGLTTGGVAKWAAPAAESLTDSFPGLRVKGLCGVGGMGAVYRAEQTRLGRDVAVKILPKAATPDEQARERFEREARILSGLNHPHILHIHDFGALPDSTMYLVMEWVGGGDLGRLMDGKPQPLAKVQAWVRQIAEALDAAHARGVIHRDLKPGNVLVREDGRLTLADFGLAHAGGGGFTTALTATGMIFGTFDYMAPEQMEAAGKVTPSADIYALGVMTYQMVTGRVPRGAYARPSRTPGVPDAVDALINAAMANDVTKRPKSATEFARLFEHACRAPERRRHRQLVGLGVALVVLALAWARAETIRAEREAMRAEQAAEARAAEARERVAAQKAQEAEALAAVERAARVEAERVAREAAARAEELAAAAERAAKVAVEGSGAGGATGETVAPEAVPAAAKEEPAAVVEEPKVERPAVPWTWVLPDVKPATDTLAGEWKMTRGELVSGEGRCALVLPVRLAINYDVAIEFTRTGGRNSVAVFLPTLAGVGTFEVDAWDLGIAGAQLIDGQDMRRTNRYFPARLVNGDKHRLILEVRGYVVSANWDGEPRMSWDLTGTRFRIPPLWAVRPEIGLGVGSWMSPTTFHRIAYRALPADWAP